MVSGELMYFAMPSFIARAPNPIQRDLMSKIEDVEPFNGYGQNKYQTNDE